MENELRVSLALGLQGWISSLNIRVSRLHAEVRDQERMRLLLAAQAVGRADSAEQVQRALYEMLVAVNAWDYAASAPRDWA